MSEFSDLAGKRDYRTSMPMTGKPYKKTYWDWQRHCWRTDICILLGARETPPSVPYAERHGRGRTDKLDKSYPSQPSQPPKRDKAPPPPKPKAGPAPGSLRDRIRRHLRTHGPATTAEVIAAVRWPNQRSVAAAINIDPLIIQVNGKAGTGRRNPDEKARWALKEGI